jgi:hypothetical protein
MPRHRLLIAGSHLVSRASKVRRPATTLRIRMQVLCTRDHKRSVVRLASSCK